MNHLVRVVIPFVDFDTGATVRVSRPVRMPFVPVAGMELRIDGLTRELQCVTYDVDTGEIEATLEDDDGCSPVTDVAAMYIKDGWDFFPDPSDERYPTRERCERFGDGLACREIGGSWMLLRPHEAEMFDLWKARKATCDS